MSIPDSPPASTQAPVVATKTISVNVSVSFIVNCDFDVELPVNATYDQAKQIAKEAFINLPNDEIGELTLGGATDYEFYPDIGEPDEEDDDEEDESEQ